MISLLFLAPCCPGTERSEIPLEPDPELRTVELGVVPLPPDHGGRDVGFSAVLKGRSVWIFGDTFLPASARDGLKWRSSSWSWSTYTPSDPGIGPWTHALDTDGLARQLLPHTEEEAAFNLAHEGHDACAAGSSCGSRRTPWPQAIVTDAAGEQAVIFYLNMETGPGGAWDFYSVSGSVASWSDPGEPALRNEPPLFARDEPPWGSAAVRVDDTIYVYGCRFDGQRKPCLLARVAFESARDRTRYRFWTGAGWSEDWREAGPVFPGGSLFSVHHNAHLGKFVAFYIPDLDGQFVMRTADLPQGPWSEPRFVGTGLAPSEDWNYALIAHPEFARENGRVETLSYNRPAGFLSQDVRLIELRLD